MLNSEIICLLKKLENDSIFDEFYFIGGTALAYYLNHRISYDLDFITLSKLKVTTLKSLVIKYDAIFVPDKEASTFKINTGNNLEEYKQTFSIDGIKVEFFYPNNNLMDDVVIKYKEESKKKYKNINLLPLKAIAELKLLALFRRNKLRDLFDIYALLDLKKITLDDIERFYSLEVGKNTLIEFIEDFKDDGSESLDFNSSNIYFKDFFGLDSVKKIELIKQRFITVIVDIELKKRELLR